MLLNSGASDDLEWLSRSLTYCKPFLMQCFAQSFNIHKMSLT